MLNGQEGAGGGAAGQAQNQAGSLPSSAGDPGNQTQVNKTDWKAGLDAEFASSIPETFSKKFEGKTTQDILKSHIELEKAIGKKTEGMFKVPDDKATPQEIEAYRAAIGVPKTAAEYKLQIPEVNNEGLPEIAEIVKSAAFEANLPAGALSKVWTKVSEAIQAQNQSLVDAGNKLMKDDDDALRSEFGNKYDTAMKASETALAKFKTGKAYGDFLTKFGFDKSKEHVRFMNEVAELVNEMPTIVGEGSSGEQKEAWFTDYKTGDKAVSVE